MSNDSHEMSALAIIDPLPCLTVSKPCLSMSFDFSLLSCADAVCLPIFGYLVFAFFKCEMSYSQMARIACRSKSCMFKVVVLQRRRLCQDACHKHIFLHSLGLKCHMGIRGWYWFCVHTCPISTQSVWQETVAITTSLWVVFLCHLPWQCPL